MKTILFVCTGNVCRSPMAEALFRQAVAGRNEIRVLSAGVGNVEGQPPSPYAVQAMQELGVDISGHRSRMLSPELLQQADLILGMTRGHVEAVVSLFPAAASKAFVLREFDERIDPFERDIMDPIGGSYEIYLHCRDQIAQGIASMLKSLDQMTKQTGTEAGETVSVALGADHAGYSLKQAIKEALQRRGARLDDFGTESEESTDYPDYAQRAAYSVSNGQSQFGILVCSSGIGMSIAANKITGIRAALAGDEESAALARSHNDANVLCLPGKRLSPDEAVKIVEAFLETPFEGGRHQRRIDKLEKPYQGDAPEVHRRDPDVAYWIRSETRRQQENIELIASENFTSLAVMEAQGTVLTNKYAEGYPKKRWYGGCECVDEVEQIAIDRAKQIFGAEHANVQPHSGSGANMAVYFAYLNPGDKILTMDLSHGGHLTHGNKANFSGRFFEVTHYGVGKEDERIDYNQLAEMARREQPKMITVGASAYPREIDFQKMGEIAREVGAYLLADIAHIAGLVAAGLHPSPVPHADFVTTTTHKTLRGPRGGLVLCRGDYAKKIDSQIFPGIQGGPLMHVIAAKAVCFQEALTPEFRQYQQQVIRNANALAEGMARNGFRLVSGGTDNHLMLVDVGARGLTGKDCQHALDHAGITVNKNTIPFETQSPFKASGVRLGTPAVTTRGMRDQEMAAIADMISEVLLDIDNEKAKEEVRERVRELTSRFSLPY